MTTITREQLIKRAQARLELMQEVAREFSESPNAQMDFRLAEIALASLEAEPVGYFYADKPGDWYQLSDGDRVPSHRRIPLYANPQSSPVVKLPNEFISSEGIVVQIEKLMAVLAVHGIQYERKGNACRAAMLQSAEPVSNRDELPEDVSTVLAEAYQVVGVMAEALGVFDDTAVQKVMDNLSQQKLIHREVLPFSLPAAPQQEVK